MAKLATWVRRKGLGGACIRGEVVKEQQGQGGPYSGGDHSAPSRVSGFKLGYRPWTLGDSSQAPELCPRDRIAQDVVVPLPAPLPFLPSGSKPGLRGRWRPPLSQTLHPDGVAARASSAWQSRPEAARPGAGEGGGWLSAAPTPLQAEVQWGKSGL